MKAINLHKKRFGKLTAYYKLSFRHKNGHVLWVCGCDCGNIKIARTGSLTSGDTKSCGCLPPGCSGIKHPAYKTKIKVTCDWCGKTKELQPSLAKTKTMHFCNRKCLGKWLSKNRRGKNSPRYKSKVITTCAYCGLSVQRDINASINIKTLGLQSVGSPVEAHVL